MDWFITDHLGSTKLLIDQNGQHRFTGDDDPFGINLRSFGDKEQHRYTGQILDEEQGMYYYGARYFLPETGRFLSGDLLREFWSLYLYARNNPTNKVDIDGMANNDPPVMIDLGHGDRNDGNDWLDAGSTFPQQQNETTLQKLAKQGNFVAREKDIVLSISKAMQEHLNKSGKVSFLTREGDTGDEDTPKFKWRVDSAVEQGCKVFVSIHANSNLKSSATGMEVYYQSQKGKELALAITKKQKTMSLRPNPIISKGWTVIRLFEKQSSDQTAVLVEVGFISNEKEAKKMIADAKKIGQEIANGVIAHFSKEYTFVGPPWPPPK